MKLVVSTVGKRIEENKGVKFKSASPPAPLLNERGGELLEALFLFFGAVYVRKLDTIGASKITPSLFRRGLG